MRFKRLLKDTFKTVKEPFQKSMLDAILKQLFLGFNRQSFCRLNLVLPIKRTSGFIGILGIIINKIFAD